MPTFSKFLRELPEMFENLCNFWKHSEILINLWKLFKRVLKIFGKFSEIFESVQKSSELFENFRKWSENVSIKGILRDFSKFSEKLRTASEVFGNPRKASENYLEPFLTHFCKFQKFSEKLRSSAIKHRKIRCNLGSRGCSPLAMLYSHCTNYSSEGHTLWGIAD